jgi:hypothetical protein
VTALVRCAVHELEGCDWCKPKPRPAEAPPFRAPTARPVTFEARYPGRCAACGETFDAGADVQREDGELVHAECETFKLALDYPNR